MCPRARRHSRDCTESFHSYRSRSDSLVTRSYFRTVSRPRNLKEQKNRFVDRKTLRRPLVYHVSSAVLPRVDLTRSHLRDVMLRASFYDDSHASRAVLYSLLCLSAVHRHGDTAKPANFKHLALRSLRKASEIDLKNPVQIQQHIAANLMLCRAEVGVI